MSYIFKLGDEIVWEPANQVARLYLDMTVAAALVLDRPSGLTDVTGDWFAIEPDAYRHFVAGLLQSYLSGRRWEVQALLRGVLTVSLGLLRRAGLEFEGRTSEEVSALADLRAELPF